eukprot:2186437-Rhodomonas_salina.1
MPSTDVASPVSSYALAMPCPVLTCYHFRIVLRVRYAIPAHTTTIISSYALAPYPVLPLSYHATHSLRPRYGMSGAEMMTFTPPPKSKPRNDIAGTHCTGCAASCV